MSNSGFNTAAGDMDALAERINDAKATLGNFEFPGQGGMARSFTTTRDALTSKAGGMSTWTTAAAGTCRTQDSIDHGLEQYPTPADLAELAAKAKATGDPADMEKFLAAADARRLLEQQHTTATAGNCLPPQSNDSFMPQQSDPNSPVSTIGDGVTGGSGEGGTDDEGDLSGLDGEGGDTTDERGMGGERTGDTTEERAAGGNVLDAPANSGSGTDTLKAAPVSADAVTTETSGDTATMTPTAGAGGQLNQPTQATPGGQPMQGMGGAPSVSTGPTGGATPQVSQPQRSGGTAPQSPEKRREEQDHQAERDATLNAGAGVAGATAAGAAAGGMASSPTAPTHASGAQSVTPAQGTPPPTNTPPAAGANAAGGMGGGMGGVRPPNGALGSGEQVSNSSMKPIYRTDTPDWLDKLAWDIDNDIDIDNANDEEPK